MKFDPKIIASWVERSATAVLAWEERRIKARQEKTLNDHRSLEICIGLCAVLIVLGLINHVSVAALRSICVLAVIIVCLKFWQLTIILLHRSGNPDK